MAALDGPQGLMSLLGRLAPEPSVASTPATPVAPVFSGPPGANIKSASD